LRSVECGWTNVIEATSIIAAIRYKINTFS